jgi:hypothetical protein
VVWRTTRKASTTAQRLRSQTRRVAPKVKRRASKVAGMLPDLPRLGVEPGVIVKRTIRKVRARLGA